MLLRPLLVVAVLSGIAFGGLVAALVPRTSAQAPPPRASAGVERVAAARPQEAGSVRLRVVVGGVLQISFRQPAPTADPTGPCASRRPIASSRRSCAAPASTRCSSGSAAPSGPTRRRPSRLAGPAWHLAAGLVRLHGRAGPLPAAHPRSTRRSTSTRRAPCAPRRGPDTRAAAVGFAHGLVPRRSRTLLSVAGRPVPVDATDGAFLTLYDAGVRSRAVTLSARTPNGQRARLDDKASHADSAELIARAPDPGGGLPDAAASTLGGVPGPSPIWRAQRCTSAGPRIIGDRMGTADLTLGKFSDPVASGGGCGSTP